MNRFVPALLKSIQDYQKFCGRGGLYTLVRKIARLKHQILSIITQSDINPEAKLGLGLQLPHPNGIVIHPDVIIGEGCMIMQQVTLGQLASGGAPTVGDRVYIGAGAKVLGRISLGDDARVGANAVVLESVPPNCTAVGNPARIIVRQSK